MDAVGNFVWIFVEIFGNLQFLEFTKMHRKTDDGDDEMKDDDLAVDIWTSTIITTNTFLDFSNHLCG